MTKFVVLCATGAEKLWVLKQCGTMQEAKAYRAKQNALQKEYHQTGHWRFEIREMTEEEIDERF